MSTIIVVNDDHSVTVNGTVVVAAPAGTYPPRTNEVAATVAAGTVVDRGAFPGVGNTTIRTVDDSRGIPSTGSIQRYTIDLTNAGTAGRSPANLALGPFNTNGVWKGTIRDAAGQVISLTIDPAGNLVAGQYGNLTATVGDDKREGMLNLAAGIAVVDLEMVVGGHTTLQWNNQ